MLARHFCYEKVHVQRARPHVLLDFDDEKVADSIDPTSLVDIGDIITQIPKFHVKLRPPDWINGDR